MSGKAAARWLRRNATDAEKALWRYLRNRAARGAKFRRQQSIGPYVVDFVCLDAHLIIEVDGGQHAINVASDAQRTAFLEGEGYRVLRFGNNDVLTNPPGVYDTIERALKSPLP
jgi:very-short-patch-repair endonuclease